MVEKYSGLETSSIEDIAGSQEAMPAPATTNGCIMLSGFLLVLIPVFFLRAAGKQAEQQIFKLTIQSNFYRGTLTTQNRIIEQKRKKKATLEQG